MLPRPNSLTRLETISTWSPITAIRENDQARMFIADKIVVYFDLDSIPDQRRLQNPELVLGSLLVEQLRRKTAKPLRDGLLRYSSGSRPVLYRWVR